MEEVVQEKELAFEDLSEKVEDLRYAHFNFTENVNSLVQAVIFPMEDQIHQNNGTAEHRLAAMDEV